MDVSQKPDFMKRLAGVMASYGKGLPEGAILTAWWSDLSPYPLRVVAMSLQAYRDECGEFAPVPAGIAMRCKVMDGRPGPEEAWAIALAGRNEEDTTVWTEECAMAFSACRSILELGDEVGARMAFREAYARLVTDARVARRPAVWTASEGWDKTKRIAAVTKAVVAGLLPMPKTVAMLSGPESISDSRSRAQINAIRKMLEDSAIAKQASLDALIEQEHRDTEEFKNRTNEQVSEYLARGSV